jgi:hypothetical protein
MQMIKKTALLALFLLPAFLLLHNSNELFGFIPARQVLIYAFVIYSILTLAYFLLSRKISPPKAALILFCTSFFLLLFTPIDDFFKIITFGKMYSSYWVFPLLTIVLILLIKKIIKTGNIPQNLIMFLNIFMICLVVTEVLTMTTNIKDLEKNHDLIYPQKPLAEKYMPSTRSDSSKPDIYFLLFDAYTNNKALKENWDFDNTQITDWLTGNGFHISPYTHSNYNFTAFSVSSTFNMNYIDAKKGIDATIKSNILQANKSISDNEAFSILKKENYSIDFLAPFKNSIQENGLGQFFEYLVDKQIANQTLPGRIYDNYLFTHLADKWAAMHDSTPPKSILDKYAFVRSTVDQVKKSADSTVNRAPHFVYAHIMVPHDPPLFNSTGTLMSKKEALAASNFDAYTAQVKFANMIMKEMVNYISQHNKRNTIIVIEGDHGYAFYPEKLKPKYAFSNFNAVYFPDKNYSRLYDNMSPVNMFRILFNQYFNQNFPLLKDSSILVKGE